jgi:RNA polymerase sigma factor for flagellar operon FliA
MTPEEAFLQFRPLARKIAGGFCRKLPRSVQRDDVFAAADMGLWLACNGKLCNYFEPRFEYYASSRIHGSIIDELRREDWAERRARSEGRAPTLVFDEAVIARFSVEPDVFEHMEVKQLVEMVRLLNAREREILTAALEGARQKDLAVKFGVSEPRINQILSSVREKMKRKMATAA